MNVNSEEESFVFIYPKRLVMIQSNLCDLCTKIHKENTYVTEMIYRFGYQHCNNCSEICQKHISLYCNYNNIFPTIQFCDRFDIKYNQKFIVQRSSGKMEENWFISTEDFIKFNKDEYFIPMFSGNTFKLVPLSKLCHLNKNMKYNDIIDYFTNF